MHRSFFALIALVPLASVRAQAVPATDVYLAPLTINGTAISVGAPVNITSRAGYDNQPAFTPDGRAILYTSIREGQADIYPRLSPTSEWDTAAGHAVLLAAGGRVDGPNGQPLWYGKRAFLNRGFVATAGWAAPPIGPFLQDFAGGGDLPQGV